MIPNAVVQHRTKHFDLLLTRELQLLKRIHEQNLITHHKFEKSLHQQLSKSKRKNISKPFNEIYNEQNEIIDYHKIHISTNNNSREKSQSSLSSNKTNQSKNDKTSFEISSKYRRYCSKPQRLPPIIKSNIPPRQKQSNNDLHWMSTFQQTNIEKENMNKLLTILNQALPKGTLLTELTPIQKQIHSFMENLPTYKGAHRGFDNFAPSSLYSTRAPVAMR